MEDLVYFDLMYKKNNLWEYQLQFSKHMCSTGHVMFRKVRLTTRASQQTIRMVSHRSTTNYAQW